MRRLLISVLACFMLFAVSNVFSQGKSEGKGKAHQKVYVCHEGEMIEINVAALQAHLDHGDVLAVETADGEWMCPCIEPTEPQPEPRECPGGTTVEAYWDQDVCEWVYPICETVEPLPQP